MGVRVWTIGGDFRVPKDNFEKASTALAEASEVPKWARETAREGGVVKVLEDVGFECAQNEDGVAGIWFVADKSYDEEEVILAAIAPFVTPGSYLEWEGEEDCSWWRWDFDGEGMTERTGRIAWTDPASDDTNSEEVVESVDWEYIVATLGIDPNAVDPAAREGIVHRAAEMYREYIGCCCGDARGDIFARAVKEARAGGGN